MQRSPHNVPTMANCRLPKALAIRFDEVVKSYGSTRHHVIKRAVTEFIERHSEPAQQKPQP